MPESNKGNTIKQCVNAIQFQLYDKHTQKHTHSSHKYPSSTPNNKLKSIYIYVYKNAAQITFYVVGIRNTYGINTIRSFYAYRIYFIHLSMQCASQTISLNIAVGNSIAFKSIHLERKNFPRQQQQMSPIWRTIFSHSFRQTDAQRNLVF